MATATTSAAQGLPMQASAPLGGSEPHAVGSVGAYLLHLADNALVLGQRNAEWCGHGPVLEEDIALANISLDLIGQARLLYQHVATLLADGADFARSGTLNKWPTPITEDTLAYFRGADEFRNFTLVELPHGIVEGERNYAFTIVRNYLYSALMELVWTALQSSADAQLAAIAQRSAKEVRYHLRHSRDWLIRLGDGTDDSHARTQAALDHLMPFVPEFWAQSAMETEAATVGVGVTGASQRAAWEANVAAALNEATLKLGPVQTLQSAGLGPAVTHGKNGNHSAFLAPLLQDMQSLARQHPGATW